MRTRVHHPQHLAPRRADSPCDLVDGPFRDLTGDWRFEAIGDRGIEGAVSGGIRIQKSSTAAALNAAFETMCSTIVDAFVVRAQKIYT